MQNTIVNPWQWQDQFGFVQGHEVRSAQRVLFGAGQASVDADGKPLHVDDIRAQTHQSLSLASHVNRSLQ